MIRTIEELSMNALPALQSLFCDGWVLRFADGYTKRANSVNPLYPGTRDIEDKIRACERIYRERKLRVVFKLTAAAQPADIDGILAAKGYFEDTRTSVRTLDLAGLDLPPTASATLAGGPSEEWIAAYCRTNCLDEGRERTLRRMLDKIVPARRFASIRRDGRVAACGLAVAQDGFVGIFDIATDPDFRRQGLAGLVVSDLMSWGQSEGARRAYLQVTLDNAPALALYSKMGFREAYQYWYRIAETDRK